MEYTGYQLLWLFFLYSLAGWCLEVSTAAVKRRKFVNIGYVNSPFCLIYGFAGVAFALFLTELKGSFFFLFLGGMVIAGFLEYVSGFFLERIFHRKWWDYSERRFQINGYICLENTIVWGIGAVLMVQFLNPLLISLFRMIPVTVRQIGLWCLLGILILDIAGSSAAVVRLHHNLARLAVQVSEDMQRLSDSLDHALTGRIQKRMVKAYPNLSVEELIRQQRLEKQRGKEQAEQSHIFAYGCSFYKLASLFFIGAFLGDIVETVFCYVTTGVLMSRSSVVYGPFSIVWGFGCALLTAFLYQYREKNDRYIFLAGTVLGGAYEYICSVISEMVFGTIFWDYSAIPFNLGGRINLLYCFFWGIVSVVWLKSIYPLLSRWIEKIPKKTGIVGCNILIVLMICDMAISGLALSRYVVRQTAQAEVPAASREVSAGENAANGNTATENAVTGNALQQGTGTTAGMAGEENRQRWLDEFLDERFPDERIERIYPNAKLVEDEKSSAASSEETEAAIDSEETDLHQAGDEILSRIGWEPGQIEHLEEIQTLLDEQGVRYTGYFNATQERLDMELEDGTKLMFLPASDSMGQNQRYQLMMVGDERFDSNGFQEDYLHQYDVTSSEYFYPDTENRMLTQEDLWSNSLNLTDLSITRNEIYARHGRIFQDAFLNAVFRTKDWYQPLYSADEFEQKAEPFSETELANIQTISEYEDCLNHVSVIDGKKLSAQRILLSGSWLDLDGDGEKERITYQLSANSDNDFGEYSLQAGDSVKKGEGINLHRYVDVIFLNDRTTLLSVGSDGPSDDPSGDYYLYQNQSLISLGQLGGELIGCQGNCLYTKGQCDFFQTFQRTYCFELDNGRFQSRSMGNHSYGNRAIAIQNIPLYKDGEFAEIGLTLLPGDEVTIVESDLESAVLIRQESTGKSGWLRCKEGYTCILPDGSEWNSWELFDGLSFYG